MKQRFLKFQQQERLIHGYLARTFYFKPHISIPLDLVNNEGEVIGITTHRLNPLLLKPLRQELIFVDGQDQAQEAWAIARIKKHKNCQIVLVSGSAFEWTKRHKRPFYLDNVGKLVKRFNVGHFPSVVSQEGDQLKIQEFVIPCDSSFKEKELKSDYHSRAISMPYDSSV